MTEQESQALQERACAKLVDLLVEVTPPEGMANKEFTDFIQSLVWCLYTQLRENISPRAGMLALGEVLQVAADQSPTHGVRVDLVPQAHVKPGKKH